MWLLLPILLVLHVVVCLLLVLVVLMQLPRSEWLGAAFGFDPVMALALAGDATTSIQLGAAVLPTWPRHPIVAAQQAATASSATGGRFRLGLGPSHAPVMAMYGIAFDRPISHLREYLEIVRALLADGQVTHQGERYQVLVTDRKPSARGTSENTLVDVVALLVGT